VAGPGGKRSGPARPFEAGPIRFRETFTVEPGRYRVRVTATDGVDTVASRPVSLFVQPAAASGASPSPPPAAAPAPPPRPEEGDPTPAILAAAVIGLGLVALLVLTARRRRGLHRR
jgi:hypothetical protein